MWGWTHQRFATHRKVTLRLPGLRLELCVPALRTGRPRSIARGWLALLAAAGCLDLAKLGFVLVWAEATGRLSPQEWVADGPRVTALMALYLIGVVGAIYFARVAWGCFRPAAPQAASRGPEDRVPPYRWRDEPPEPRRCGVPVRPRGPRPLVARCRTPHEALAGRRRERALERSVSV